MTSRQVDLQEDIKFRVMRLIQENPSLTQRDLAKELGISLGGINYCLIALIAKGFVKMHNFNRAQNKLKYAYILTPSGIKERSSLTYCFLERKLKEYEDLKAEINALKSEDEIFKPKC
jgi:EPS-associated MarR family transcriptional regulator